jgi:hypothetical protein
MSKLPADVKARFLAQYDELMRWRPPLAKPRLVCDGGKIDGDRSTIRAASGSRGPPHTPDPHNRMAPKPIRVTTRSPPIVTEKRLFVMGITDSGEDSE